jgi:hypothetical protein
MYAVQVGWEEDDRTHNALTYDPATIATVSFVNLFDERSLRTSEPGRAIRVRKQDCREDTVSGEKKNIGERTAITDTLPSEANAHIVCSAWMPASTCGSIVVISLSLSTLPRSGRSRHVDQ